MMIGEVTPILFVGLGGAGGRVVGRLAKRVRNQENARKYADLTKLVVIDTDASATKVLRQGKEGFGPVDETFVISDFDKQQYAALARGEQFAIEDPYFTQWVYPDYVFRGGDTAGAGQIRIESRLGLYHAQRTGDLHAKMQKLLNDLREHTRTGAAVDAPVQAHVVFSIAGGTGSGTFLSFAYFLQRLAQGVVPLQIFGYAIQPHVFEEVTGANFEDVCANSYAALKELEAFNQLEAQVGGAQRELELHFDVAERLGPRPTVQRRPFEATYLIDVPEGYYTPTLLDAVADAIHFQIYTPFGEKQASDVDNYAKHSRALYPADLARATGRGYTPFYGTLGLCVLQIPDDDLLRYCALRFAADAVRSYLLMADPELVPEARRAEFHRFQIPDAELKQLSQSAQKRRMDEVFVRKVELLADTYRERPESFWGRLGSVASGIEGRFDEALEALVDKVVGAAGETLPGLSPEAVATHTWTGDSAHQELRAKLRRAQDEVAARLEVQIQQAGYDWWPAFLASAGPPSAPDLTPYEQRYVLLALRGLCASLRGEDAPLSPESVERAAAEQDEASRAFSEASDADFARSLTARTEELRGTAPRSFWDRTFRSSDLDEAFEEARRGVVDVYNRRVGSLKLALRTRARAALLRSLAQACERVLDTFRNIDTQGEAAARELTQRAEDYRLKGVLREALPDGRLFEHYSEANEFVVDEEALLGPSRERLWDWYYADQILPLLRGPEQVKAVQHALTEALKPRHTPDGLEIPRSGQRVIQDIVFAIRATLQERLEERIRGLDGNSGLLLEDAIALEALYQRQMEWERGAAPREALRPFLGAGGSVDPAQLWEHPEVGSRIKAYVGEKLDRAVKHKAALFADVDREKLGAMPYAEATLVGAHRGYRGDGPFARSLATVVAGVKGSFLPEWRDAKRIVIYHYLRGVPLYVFPRVTGPLQAAYREHQENPHRAWYLHVDRNFEALPDLDPHDIKRSLDEQASLRLPLFFAKGLLELSEDGDVLLRGPGGEREFLAETLGAVAAALARTEGQRPEFYRTQIAPQYERLDHVLKRRRLDDGNRKLLAALEPKLAEAVLGLEGPAAADTPPNLAEALRALLAATRSLLALPPLTAGLGSLAVSTE